MAYSKILQKIKDLSEESEPPTAAPASFSATGD